MEKTKIFRFTLITIVISFAVHIILSILNSRLTVELPDEPVTKTSLSGSKETKPFTAYASISARNLFEAVETAEVIEVKPDETEDVPLTDLKLTLKGTVVGSKELSFAIIEDGKLKSQNLYHLEDSISSGVTLSAIHEDRVVINRNGNKELLLMFEEDPKKKGDKPSPSPPRTVRPPSPIRPSEVTTGSMKDLKYLLRNIRIIPHFTDGQRDGFTVTYVLDGSYMAQRGLRKNDIIKDVNGKSAMDFKNLFEIFNVFSEVDTVDLGIERDNQLITITLDLEDEG